METSKRKQLRWAEEVRASALQWREDVGPKPAVKRAAPSEPHLTDEYGATDGHLWKTCLAVASGDLREFTKSGRTIHAPNDGLGFRNMPANPNGIAWAVKQYNGFGGAWRGHKEAAEHLAELRILAHGGVVQTPAGKFDALAASGLVKLAGKSASGLFWDITRKGRRVVAAMLEPIEILPREKGRR